MQVEYQISEDDFAAAASLVMCKRYKALMRMQILCGVCLLYVAYSIARGTAETGKWPGAILPLVIFLLPFWIAYQSRKQYKKLTVLHERRTLSVNETGTHFKSQSIDANVAWPNYVGFFEDKRSFALMQQGSQIFVPIPKRELTALEIDQLRALFESKIRNR